MDGRLVSDFEARLRAFREAAGLTQQELADRVRCSRKQGGRWEAGETLPQRTRLAHPEPPLGLVPGTLSEVLESLIVAETAVTAGLKELAGLKQLKFLSVHGTKVTTAGLKELAGFGYFIKCVHSDKDSRTVLIWVFIEITIFLVA